MHKTVGTGNQAAAVNNATSRKFEEAVEWEGTVLMYFLLL